jgi:hypothetical protein
MHLSLATNPAFDHLKFDWKTSKNEKTGNHRRHLQEYEIDRENRDWGQVDRENRDWEMTMEYEIDRENRDWGKSIARIAIGR